MSTDLDAALLEVRKAYRLLEDYQRRMFELLAYIREQLRATPYHQEYILPSYLHHSPNLLRHESRYRFQHELPRREKNSR